MMGQPMIKRLVVVTLLLAVLVRAPLASAEAPSRQEDRLQIAFSVPGLQFDFFLNMLNVASQKANELDVELVNAEGQVDPAVQSSGILEMIDQGVDGIIISPFDEELLQIPVQAAIDAGIPVVTVDRTLPNVKTVGHVGADNVRGGEIQGEFLLSLLPNGGKVIEIQGFLEASPAVDRSKGFNDAIAGHPEIEVVYQSSANFRRDDAFRIAERELRFNPDVAAIVCANDDMCLGASEAAKGAGLDVKTIGFDALPEALQAIQHGNLTATVDQWAGRQASEAVEMIVNFIRTGVQPNEQTVLIEPTLITSGNLGEAERAEEAGITPTGTPDGTPEATLRYD
jgi:inositol transport system substrate-binding protein